MSKVIPKFRPYLSVPALQRILHHISETPDNIDKEIQEQITIILTRNGIGAAKPAYIATPRETLEEKLGFETSSEEAPIDLFESLKKEFGVTKP